MMVGSEVRDGAETDGGSLPPSTSSSDPVATPPTAATVVITASSLDDECFVRASGEDVAGGRKVLVEQQQGKGGAGVADAGPCVAVDVGRMDGSGDLDAEKVCRICHLSPDRGKKGSELIQIGCGCKDELGIAHPHCAETWFRLKGNRYCEICGANAKNITGEEDGSFIEEWHEGRRVLSSRGNTRSSESGGCWRGHSLCNFLMACLVIAFILPWFFRINMF